MDAVIFGAGNVGRGFLGLEMFLRDYVITFVDVDKEVADYLNRNREYLVTFFGRESTEIVKIREALHISQENSIRRALRSADVILTAVGTGNLEALSATIAGGIKNSKDQLVIACENAPRNTAKLEEYVAKVIPKPKDYAEFANCVIDRICLREGDSIIVEPTFEWVVETNSNLLRNVEKTDNLDPFFTRKLFLVNGSHAIIGYAGTQRNFRYVHETLKDKETRSLVEGALRESCFGLSKEYGFDIKSLDDYVVNLQQRFSNPVIKDEVSRLVRDPIRKLQRDERLIGPMLLAYKYGLFPENLCRSIAYLLMYGEGTEGHRLQESISTKGVKSSLSQYTGLNERSELIYKIELEYGKLQNH